MNKIIAAIRRYKWFKISSFAFLGGIAGFAYYYFVGCQSGSCPITSNPFISTSYGMVIGFLFSLDKKKGKE